jgi:hypothetical protein
MPTRLAPCLLALVVLLVAAAPAAAVPDGSTFLLSRPSGLGALPSGAVNDSWLGVGVGGQTGGGTTVSGSGR